MCVVMSASAETLAATIKSPEGIRIGDYVAVMRATQDLPSFLWCSESSGLSPEQPVRYHAIPEDSGVPLKVRAICLPFLHVRNPRGRHLTLDIRRHQLARLCRSYAKQVIRLVPGKTRRDRRR